MGVTGSSHLRCIGIKYCLVMCFVVFVEDLVILFIDGITIVGSSFLCHLDATIWHEGTLERLVCLKTYDLFEVLHFLTDITRTICCKSGNNFSFTFQHAAFFSFFLLQFLYGIPQFYSSLSRFCQEGFISFVLCVVGLNKIADIDVFCPVAFSKASPFFFHVFSSFQYIFSLMNHLLIRWGYIL